MDPTNKRSNSEISVPSQVQEDRMCTKKERKLFFMLMNEGTKEC